MTLEILPRSPGVGEFNNRVRIECSGVAAGGVRDCTDDYGGMTAWFNAVDFDDIVRQLRAAGREIPRKIRLPHRIGEPEMIQELSEDEGFALAIASEVTGAFWEDHGQRPLATAIFLDGKPMSEWGQKVHA